MITIDDIIKRSRYLNMSNKEQEYAKHHSKSKLLMESNAYRFEDVRFLLQHWESLSENQAECFRKVIDILDETYENGNMRDFNYTKNYIINEVTPTVRDAKQSSRYLKYKTSMMKTKITRKLKKNVEDIKSAAASNKPTVPSSKSLNTMKGNVKKNIGVHEAYVQILDSLDKYHHCDRILENNYNIQKRFNIMNMIERSDINYEPALRALVDSICECVNTYDSDFGTRFNTALETCFYFLSREDKNFNKSMVLEQVVDNFVCGDLPYENLLEMRSIIESSVTYDDKSSVDFIYTATPFQDVTELAKPFLESTDKNMINLGNTISNISNDMTDNDIRKVFISMRNITESKDCKLDNLLYSLSFLHTSGNFNKLCAEEIKHYKKNLNITSENDPEPDYIQALSKYGSKCNLSEAVLIMEDFDEPVNEGVIKTVRDIINDFKLAKKNKPADVRTCVSKMFTKSADQIIEGTPNFFSWIRMTYVLGATALHPVLGGITLIVDKFIEMKLQRRDTDKMIKKFKKEREKVKAKLEKTVDEKDKKNLEEYDKYLEKGLEKLIKYRESLMSSLELDSERFGDDYDKNKEMKDIFGDEDNDEDFDYNTESAFEKLLKRTNYLSKDYFTSNIKDSLCMMNEDTIDTITDIACKYPSVINTSKLFAILKEEYETIKNNHDSKRWVRMSCLSSNIRKLDPDSTEYSVNEQSDACTVFEIVNELEDLFTEYSINKSMSINESLNTMVKSITVKLRRTMQKASDTDKELSKKIDSSVNMFVSAIQRHIKNDNREAILRGSIIPSASKVVKLAITTGAIALVSPAIAVITALGQIVARKHVQKKERQLVLDEIDIELDMCRRYMRQAEDQNDLAAQKRLLQIEKNLIRQKQRIQYNMKVEWGQNVPDTKKDDDY